MIGQTLGHYRVLEQIGAGGMGVVYRAHDERLDRDVALKVLPAGTLADESARKRFRKEALTLSKLNHPNIETVFDFDTQDGVDFLVMELIPGVTLDQKLVAGALPEKEVLRLGQQLAEGLAAAHAEGVIHRDLKPGNLRLTPDGRLKILDFGLAKLLQPASGVAAMVSTTETHAVAGTLPYMTPEQLRGEAADARSDIWAAGAVLYELATGRRPFDAKISTALAGDIQHKPPPPPRQLKPDLSPKVEDVILKCLEKDPQIRYQSARELAVDLRRTAASVSAVATAAPPTQKGRKAVLTLALGLGLALALALVAAVLNPAGWRDRWLDRGGTEEIRSIAVLPLKNLSGDPEQEYFADGMTEAVITELSKIRALKVISLTSAMQYKEARKPLPQIARELNVEGVVQGSVLREGDQVRVSVQLIHGPTDRHLWAGNFDRELRRILLLQSEVAQAVTREIKVAVTPAEESRLAQNRAVNPSAYHAYLKGRYHWNKRTRPGVRKGLEYFQQALDIDPSYALAYAGVADSYAVENGAYLGLSAKEARPRAKAAAVKALELDPNLAEARTTLADCLLYYEWDWAAAEQEFKLAVELNPNYATTRQWYAELLFSLGRYDAAIEQVRRAEQLDPLSASIATSVAVNYYMARRYPEAIQQLQQVTKMDPNFPPAYGWLATVYGVYGMHKESVEAREKLLVLLGNPRRRPPSGRVLRNRAIEGLCKSRLKTCTGFPSEAMSPRPCLPACMRTSEKSTRRLPGWRRPTRNAVEF